MFETEIYNWIGIFGISSACIGAAVTFLVMSYRHEQSIRKLEEVYGTGLQIQGSKGKRVREEVHCGVYAPGSLQSKERADADLCRYPDQHRSGEPQGSRSRSSDSG